MLTLFSVPKPFDGHVGVIQQNAIETWSALRPACEIILFGDDAGVRASAHQYGALHEPDVARTAHGTPRLDDVFGRARRLARFDLLCFVNADILLPPQLIAAVEQLRKRFNAFVALGQCRNLDLAKPIAGVDWQRRALEDGETRPPGGIDYLVFSRDLYEHVPPFALGRAGFDNWLVWDARRRRIPVVNLTPVVTAVHQNHDYGHVLGGKEASYRGVEARENIVLAGGELRLYNIDDATHRLETRGLVRNVLAPIRRMAPARWLALRWGEAGRTLTARRLRV